jgi:hypothetical protein
LNICHPSYEVWWESTEASDEEDEDEDEIPQGFAQGERNSQLTVGYKGDRSYVVRGNNIGVFNHSPGSNVKYYATISKIATPKGKEFKPKNVRIEVCFIRGQSTYFL